MKTMLKVLPITAIVAVAPSRSFGQWIHLSGPEGGYIPAIVACGPDVFAGSYGAGIFRSTDNGNHWTPSSSGLINAYIWSMAVCDSLVLAGTARDLYTSSDRGTSWNAAGLCRGNVWSLAVWGNEILAGTTAGTFRSTDRGRTWTNISFNWEVYALARDSTRIVAGTHGQGIYVSLDNGMNWTPVGLAEYWQGALAIVDGSILAGGVGCHRSTDNGATWVAVDSNAHYRSFITMDSVIYAASSPIKRSTDGGASWSTAFSPPGVVVTSCAFKDTFLLAGIYSEGICRSPISENRWTFVNTGLSAAEVVTLSVRDSILIAGTESWTYRSVDKGLSWAKIPGLFGYGVCAWIGATMFVGCSYGGVSRSSDGGATWTKTGELPKRDISRLVASDSTLLCSVYEHGIYRSTDQGEHWVASNSGLLDTTDVWLEKPDGPFVYAVGSWSISRSSDVGLTWEQIASFNSSTQPQSTGPLAAIGPKLYMGTWAQGFYASTDYGQSWTRVDADLGTEIVLSVLTVDGNLFVGTHDNGVFLSIDEGGTWSNVSEGLLKTRIRALATDDTHAYLCGVSNIWARPLEQMAPMTAVNDRPDVPGTICLFQNYPNPFNPSTTIRYQLPNRSHVTLRIFNLLGQRVATLVDEVQEAGYKSVEFNASGLPSGMYLYRLRAGGFVETRKLLLLK